MTRTVLAGGMLCAVVSFGAMRSDAQAQTAATPTFSMAAAPIHYKNCTNCHRPGEIAPMSLLTYQNARPWAKAIATRVAAGTMPPWHADSSRVAFSNDRHLNDADKATLLAWANGGAPEGNPQDLPPQPTYAQGWSIGEPNVVLKMQEDYPIPASGVVAYQYFEVPTNFTEDRWIQGFEVRPGNRAVVHHVIVYARPPAQPERPAAPAGSSQRRPQVIEFAEGMD